MLNSNIYFNQRGAADLMGGVRQGMTIGEMVKRSRRDDYNFKKQKESDQRQATVRDIFSSNFKQGEDGAYSLDRKATLGQLASTDPEIAMKMQKQWTMQDQAKADREMALSDREFDRRYKSKVLDQKSAKQANEEKRKNEELELKRQEIAAKSDKTKGDQFKVGGFAKRAMMAEDALSKLPAETGTAWHDSITGSEYFPEFGKSEDRKLFDQSQRNFISAVLRRESGAAISDQEMENESMKYFPQPGDSEAVLAQKRQSRIQAINNLKAEAGNAVDKIATAPLNQKKRSFDIPGVKNAYASSPLEHPQKSEALKWAEKNSKDPRAKEILRRLGR